MSDNRIIVDGNMSVEEARKQNQLLEDADKVRKAGLYNQTVGGRDILSASPSQLDKGKYRHDYDPNSKRNFDEKIFMFPESYNALRKELHDNWPNLWALVGWRMAHRAEEFVEYMNDALDLAVVFDTEAVDFICTTYLNALKKKRGAA